MPENGITPITEMDEPLRIDVRLVPLSKPHRWSLKLFKSRLKACVHSLAAVTVSAMTLMPCRATTKQQRLTSSWLCSVKSNPPPISSSSPAPVHSPSLPAPPVSVEALALDPENDQKHHPVRWYTLAPHPTIACLMCQRNRPWLNLGSLVSAVQTKAHSVR